MSHASCLKKYAFVALIASVSGTINTDLGTARVVAARPRAEKFERFCTRHHLGGPALVLVPGFAAARLHFASFCRRGITSEHTNAAASPFLAPGCASWCQLCESAGGGFFLISKGISDSCVNPILESVRLCTEGVIIMVVRRPPDGRRCHVVKDLFSLI